MSISKTSSLEFFLKPATNHLEKFCTENANLKDLSYYKTGGHCAYLLSPASIEEFQEALLFLKKRNLSYFLLGEGSNSLISDKFWPGGVISFRRFKDFHVSGNCFIVKAGALNRELSLWAHENSFSNLEWMHLLPGEIGATTRMNARCYGGEISQVVSYVKSIDKDGNIVERDVAKDPQIFLGYKNTIFMRNGEIILEVKIKLSRDKNSQDRLAIMKNIETDRIAKGHFLEPSCGCVFKNDYSVGVPSGLLIQEAKLKGLKRGQAEISGKHANFMFNVEGKADSQALLELSKAVQQKVYDDFGVFLEYEMEFLGDFLKENIFENKPRQKHAVFDEKIKILREAFQKQMASR